MTPFKDYMLDPKTMTVGELVSTLRDSAFLVGILVFGWKARALVQPLIDFFVDAKDVFARAIKHMDMMEIGMHTLLTNHLVHMEADLKSLSGRKSDHPLTDNPEV